MKKVIIIGAGIAGLTCGIYARINGFETEIYEQHAIPGGECTGWDRGVYHFDGCLRWLAGTKPGTGLNALWRDTGALAPDTAVAQYDVFARYEEGDQAVILYANADALKNHLYEIAPQDKAAIRRMCADIRAIGAMDIPLKKPPDLITGKDGLRYFMDSPRSCLRMLRFGGMTMGKYVRRFRSPLLRAALLSCFPAHYSALALLSTLAGMHAGDCGLPEDGSRALAKRMERRYLALGGNIFYRARVERIIENEGLACGILLEDGSQHFSDYVVSCADAHHTFAALLHGRYTPQPYAHLFAHPQRFPAVTSAVVYIGIAAPLAHPRGMIHLHRTPKKVCGIRCDCTRFIHFGSDAGNAPDGKSVIACLYDANYDHWSNLYADADAYRREKRKLHQDALSELYRRFPEAYNKVEVTDIVTPMTYANDFNAWRGSWMSWVSRQKGVPGYFPGTLDGLKNFLLAGMWTLPPGGLPGAAAAGRFAAHRLCLLNGLRFYTDEQEAAQAREAEQSETIEG